MLSEKIRTLRKQAGLSQERLAGKLGVSRQAVTKWETDAGAPDIENLRALSALFGVSLDALLDSGARSGTHAPRGDFLYESVTEYDVDGEKRCDITLPGARRVTLAGYDGEKLGVRLASDRLADIQSAFKVRIDDIKNRIDVDMRRFGDMTEAAAKEALHIFIRLPRRYVRAVELGGNAGTLVIRGLRAENIEFTGKASRVVLSGAGGHIELNSNEDLAIVCAGLDGRLDINQISATSRLSLPAGTVFTAAVRGIGNSIRYERDGEPAEDLSAKQEGEPACAACENRIELNGMRSELVIDAVSDPAALEE